MYQGCTSPFQNWTVQNADCRLTADHCISGLENSQWDYFCLVLIAWWKQWFVAVCSLHFVLTDSKTTQACFPWSKCRAFDFFEKFGSNSWLCWLFSWSNPPPARRSKHQKPPPTNDYSKILPSKTIYSSVNILKRTQISNQVSESCRTKFLTN